MRIRRPSLLAGLLWTGLGIVFLLRNFGIVPDFWSVAGRYWPLLLILLGLGKVIDYFRQKDGVSVRIGEVFGIVFLFVLGIIATKISNSPIPRLLGDIPIHIGGREVRPGEWMGKSYSFSSQEATYALSAPVPLRIENSYGSVTVTPGSDREIRVRLRKEVYHNEGARAKEIADEIKLEGGPEGAAEATSFVVKTNRDEIAAKDYRFNTHMEVLIPKKSQMQVRNAYGEVTVSNLEGKLDLSTTHKPLDVRDCTGDIVASNRYADSRLLNITGNVQVDARGRVLLETIKGDVNVRNEYSPVEITNVDGKVTVSVTDSSVTLDKVTKPVVIDARGSVVTARNLTGNVKVTTSHRRVKISDVAANVSLDSRYSSLSIENVKGNVDIASNSDRITAKDVGGSLKVQAQGSSVRADTVTGPMDINTTRKNVIVNDFANGCRISNEYSDVTLSARSLGPEEIVVRNRNGAIELFLPEDASFQINAIARNGRLTSDFSGLELSQDSGDNGILKGKVKDGGPKIRLENDYGAIHLRTRGRGEDSERPRESSERHRKSSKRSTN